MSLSKYFNRELSTPDIGDQPHQPLSIKFPHREFGKKNVVKRSFQPQWFNRWTWLHYVEDQDAAFCFVCVKAYKEKKLVSISNMETTYISTGYTNWKDASIRFAGHEASLCHKDALLKVVTLPATTQNVCESLSALHAQEMKSNRQCFLKLLLTLKTLARQALPLRGHNDDSDSNYIQILKLLAQHDSKFQEWLGKKSNKYTSGEIQNEMLKVMSLNILREISSILRESLFYTVMVDETTDVSNSEQVVICIRWVSKKFEVHEEFIGLYVVKKIDANTLLTVIRDVLHRLGIPLSKLRGQCYDGAASMSGSKSGVAKMILDEEPRALYTHCYGHALNLACGDTMKQCKIMRDSLDVTYEITKLIKKSPRREACFQNLKGNYFS